jgi:hypothetical protein
MMESTMFSPNDFDRGPRLPLLWLWGPILLGAVLITALTLAVRATQGFPNIELADAIRQADAAGDPLLAEVATFDWDRVCVFPPEASMDDVDERLGIDWGVIGGDGMSDRRQLLVFANGDAVVTHVFVPGGTVDAPEGLGDCRGPDEASTRL